MLLTEIDHVAIAVKDLEAAIDYYKSAFGATVDHREVVESDGVEEALVRRGDAGDQAGGGHARRIGRHRRGPGRAAARPTWETTPSTHVPGRANGRGHGVWPRRTPAPREMREMEPPEQTRKRGP